MTAFADLASWIYTSLFVLLAVAVASDWYRRREPGHGVLVLAVTSLASATVFGKLDVLFPAGAAVFTVGALVAIVAAAYFLFLFRDAFVPSRRSVRVVIGVTAACALVLIIFVALVVKDDQSPLSLLAQVLLSILWIACVGDSIVRFWRVSRGRSPLQRFRLRALSVGYSAILLDLLISVSTTYVPSTTTLGRAVDVGSSILIVLIAPLLYVAFSPPQWLRRYWRRGEVDLYRQGLEDLLLLSTDRRLLADRALDSVLRLVGAEQAVLIDETGAVLAERNLSPGLLVKLFEARTSGAEHGIVRVGEERLTAIALPMPFADGEGLLGVVSGPFSPFFGAHEVRLLGQYTLSITAALERVRLIEALAEASRAKSEFLSRMSHELRTPLNSILGFAQLLETEDLPVDQRGSVQRIHRAGDHLLNLINEILDLSRIESGRMSITAEPVAVRSALVEATDLVQPLAAKRGITLETDLGFGALAVRADRQRFVQVLLNLLSNAAKYSPAGGTVRISAEVTAHVARISVLDQGEAISPEASKRLFQPFDRLGAEGTGIEGTGIGLSLSRALAHLMGGDIGLQSTAGKGNNFWVELPVVGATDEPEASTLKATPPDARSGTGAILYVEDNVLNIDLVRRILGRHTDRWRLDVAMLGRLGLDLASQHHYDLVLLDLNLPDLSGMEVLRRLREDARTRGLPVFIVSADATQTRIDEAMAAGADNYVTKPINVKEFIAAIEKVLPG
jgi:signal transduction histidine kinase